MDLLILMVLSVYHWYRYLQSKIAQLFIQQIILLYHCITKSLYGIRRLVQPRLLLYLFIILIIVCKLFATVVLRGSVRQFCAGVVDPPSGERPVHVNPFSVLEPAAVNTLCGDGLADCARLSRHLCKHRTLNSYYRLYRCNILYSYSYIIVVNK